MLNADVAEALDEIADILEIQGDRFRPRAYRRAARSIESSSADLVQLMASNQLTRIPGVGESIASKISEFVQTGRITYLEELRKKVPSGVAQLLKIPDVGPKTVKLFYEKLGIASIDDLERAIESKKLRTLKGIGPKTEENLIRGINLVRRGGSRMLLGRALPVGLEIQRHLSSTPGVQRISLAGSLRRMKETVGDLDVLVTSSSPPVVTEAFTSMPMVKHILAKGETKSSVLLTNGLQVDLRIVPDDCFGSALQYFTGSKEHNIKLREIAQRRSMKLSEYGLFDASGRRIAGRNEEEIYRSLGMSYIEPELRENTGEIEAAAEGKLPKIITTGDIRGDFHVHSSWSDGNQDILSIALKARALGYEYICITDHSHTLRIARGLHEDQVLKQVDEIREVNAQLGDRPKVLAGLEVDIKADGSLDTKDEVLEQLDLVIASVHSRLKSTRASMTERMVQALSTGLVSILGHPTGRILGQREACALDEDVLFDAALQHRTWMEINAFPDRLDLDEGMARRAAGMGIKLAIGTDSHDVEQLNYMMFGVAVARRSWLERKDVANCMGKAEVVRALAEMRARR